MAGVDVVQDGLTDEVIGDREQFQPMLFEQISLAGAVGIVGECLIDFEVVAPAGEFETVVTEVAGLFTEFFERKIGPLAGEQGDWSRHYCFPFKLGC
jgi:hypothetical protein